MLSHRETLVWLAEKQIDLSMNRISWVGYSCMILLYLMHVRVMFPRLAHIGSKLIAGTVIYIQYMHKNYSSGEIYILSLWLHQ